MNTYMILKIYNKIIQINKRCKINTRHKLFYFVLIPRSIHNRYFRLQIYFNLLLNPISAFYMASIIRSYNKRPKQLKRNYSRYSSVNCFVSNPTEKTRSGCVATDYTSVYGQYRTIVLYGQ